jgi:translation initiation factor 1 (eIF-1/SUI1)
LAAVDNDLDDLVKRFKQSCGAGGTVAGDTIEIQGDHLESIAQLLKTRGFRVK